MRLFCFARISRAAAAVRHFAEYGFDLIKKISNFKKGLTNCAFCVIIKMLLNQPSHREEI